MHSTVPSSQRGHSDEHRMGCGLCCSLSHCFWHRGCMPRFMGTQEILEIMPLYPTAPQTTGSFQLSFILFRLRLWSVGVPVNISPSYVRRNRMSNFHCPPTLPTPNFLLTPQKKLKNVQCYSCTMRRPLNLP